MGWRRSEQERTDILAMKSMFVSDADLRADWIAEEDTTTRHVLQRVSFTLAHPSHRLEAAGDVKAIASLGSDETCANSIFSRESETVEYELATIALSLMSGIDHEQIQRPGVPPRTGPVVARERMRELENICFARIGCAVLGFVCGLLVMLLQYQRYTMDFVTRCRRFGERPLVTTVSASPISVPSDSLPTIFHFITDDVMTLSTAELPLKASPEVCHEVFWVFMSVRMQQVTE